MDGFDWVENSLFASFGVTLKSKYLSGAHRFLRFLDTLTTSASCMLCHIVFIILVCDRFCDCCTYQNNYFQDQWKPSFWSSTPSHASFAKKVVVIFFCFCNVHRNDNEICIVLLFHALFCLVLCVPAVTRQVATHCPLLVGKQHCFSKTLGLCGCCCPLCHCPARNTMCRSLSLREGLLLMGL